MMTLFKTNNKKKKKINHVSETCLLLINAEIMDLEILNARIHINSVSEILHVYIYIYIIGNQT